MSKINTNSFAFNTLVAVVIGSILGIIFVILRLTGVTDWDWWAVTSPFWGTAIGILLNFLIGGAAFRIYKSETARQGHAGFAASINVGIIFIILRLVGFIDWSWWGVTAPIWVPVGIYLIVIILYRIVKSGKRGRS